MTTEFKLICEYCGIHAEPKKIVFAPKRILAECAECHEATEYWISFEQ